MKRGARSKVPDALFELVGDGVVAVVVFVDAGEDGGELSLVAHAEDLDPGLGGLVVPGGKKGDRGRGPPVLLFSLGLGQDGGHG